MGSSVPYSIVRYFQAKVSQLTGADLDLLNSPKAGLELGKARLLLEYCDNDVLQVMRVIDQSLTECYVLDHPTLAVVHSKVEQYLYRLRRRWESDSGDYLSPGKLPEYDSYLDSQARKVAL